MNGTAKIDETWDFKTVPAKEWRQAAENMLNQEAQFCGLFALAAGGGVTVRAIFTKNTATTFVSCLTDNSEIETLVDIIPAAAWDEREAHDLFDIRFIGHEPMRSLVSHPQNPKAWMVDIEGDGTHDVAVGPIHAGVIESGHFRFHVVGERILAVDLRLFYKHRGLEAAAAGLPMNEAVTYAQRACGACAVTNSVAYAQACEAAIGLWPTLEMRRARTLLLELERLYNHLNDISAICAGVGFAAGTMAVAGLKERAMRLNARITGHRFLFGTVVVGGNALSVDKEISDRERSEIQELRQDTVKIERELRFATSLQARLNGVGELQASDALRLGAVGPSARASGINRDVRSESPRLLYGKDFTPAQPKGPVGDVAARFQMRATELEATFNILDEQLSTPTVPSKAELSREPNSIAIGRVESPRGETVCAVERNGDNLERMHLRTGSYANWPSLAHATIGDLLPDFPLINKSFELCYACVDR